jgi:hypothetical protein
MMQDRFVLLLLPCALAAILAGCGTTKWTDTKRSATEQLLISDAMDRAVNQIDFRGLAGRPVYLDAKPLAGATDADYLISSLRQHMLASGCILKDKDTEAECIVEARAGAVGTDHHDLTYGIPAVSIPAVIPVNGFGIPPQIPEMPFVTRTDQRAVAKIAVFAYNRETGRPVWQSGIIPVESTAKATWLFGAGPFQRGSIYEGTEFAGERLKTLLFGARPFRPGSPGQGTDLASQKLNIPLVDLSAGAEGPIDRVSVGKEAYFVEFAEKVAQRPAKPEPNDAAKPAEPANDSSPAGAAPQEPPADPAASSPQPAAKRPPGQPPPTVPPAVNTAPIGVLPSDPQAPLPSVPDRFNQPAGSPYPWYDESLLDRPSAPTAVSPWLDPESIR